MRGAPFVLVLVLVLAKKQVPLFSVGGRKVETVWWPFLPLQTLMKSLFLSYLLIH